MRIYSARGSIRYYWAWLPASLSAAQIFNIDINLFLHWSTLLTPLVILYLLLRFVAPGVIWGWVYWRYGFVANEIVAVSMHLFLQPAMSLFF